jgi:hypothetical protein
MSVEQPEGDYQPDSRDRLPPEDMRTIFEEIQRARADTNIDGDGQGAAMDHLIDAVEELAKYIAGNRGRHV